jgi:hypothetical protein
MRRTDVGVVKMVRYDRSVRRPNPSRRGRGDPKQLASNFQVSYGPSTAYASDHPAQYGPKIALDCLFIEHLQRWGERMDLYTCRKGFTAATNEDESIFSPRGRREIARFAQADTVEIECVDEEGTELRIVSYPVLGENEGATLAF